MTWQAGIKPGLQQPIQPMTTQPGSAPQSSGCHMEAPPHRQAITPTDVPPALLTAGRAVRLHTISRRAPRRHLAIPAALRSQAASQKSPT